MDFCCILILVSLQRGIYYLKILCSGGGVGLPGKNEKKVKGKERKGGKIGKKLRGKEKFVSKTG